MFYQKGLLTSFLIRFALALLELLDFLSWHLISCFAFADSTCANLIWIHFHVLFGQKTSVVWKRSFTCGFMKHRREVTPGYTGVQWEMEGSILIDDCDHIGSQLQWEKRNLPSIEAQGWNCSRLMLTVRMKNHVIDITRLRHIPCCCFCCHYRCNQRTWHNIFLPRSETKLNAFLIATSIASHCPESNITALFNVGFKYNHLEFCESVILRTIWPLFLTKNKFFTNKFIERALQRLKQSCQP